MDAAPQIQRGTLQSTTRAQPDGAHANDGRLGDSGVCSGGSSVLAPSTSGFEDEEATGLLHLTAAAASSDSDFSSDADGGRNRGPDMGRSARFAALMSSWQEDPAASLPPGGSPAGLSADVLAYYNNYGDADAASSLYAKEGDVLGESPFDQPGLKDLFYFVCTAGGVGLSRNETRSFYNATRAYERACGSSNSLLRAPFPSA